MDHGRGSTHAGPPGASPGVAGAAHRHAADGPVIAGPVIVTTSLTRTFGAVTALSDLTVEIPTVRARRR